MPRRRRQPLVVSAGDQPVGTTPGRPVAVIGGTAGGKSSVAMAIATGDPGWEIVSVDSMQVYRGMDIGTAKPTMHDRQLVPHHMVDVADPDEDYDVATFQAAARAAIADIESRGRRALLVGGTALYLRAIVDDLAFPGRFPAIRAELETQAASADGVRQLHGRLRAVDPVAADRMEPTNTRRIIRALEVTMGSGQPFSSFGPGLAQHPETRFRLVGLGWDRTVLDGRIDDRFNAQMEAGFVDEVRQLRTRGLARTAAQALGYRELGDYLDGVHPLDVAVADAKTRIRRFSRRQDKWFRRDPRITWVDGDGDPAAVARAVSAAVEEVAPR